MKQLFSSIAALLLLSGAAAAQQGKPAWLADNVEYSSVPSDIQGGARVTVAYNGHIYATALLSDAGGQPYGWELRKSTDNGATWATLRYDGTTMLNSTEQHIEVYAAGKNAADFKLFVARSWTSGGDGHLRLDVYNAGGVLQNTPIDESYSAATGFVDMSLVSDDQMPSGNNVPYAAALVVAKRAASDSILAYVSEDGGATWPHRSYVASTSAYYRSVSAAYGSSPETTWGRIGIAWWETETSADEYGEVRVTSVFGDDGTQNVSVTPYLVPGQTRRPAIAMAMYATGTAMPALVLYEKSGIDPIQGTWIYNTITEIQVNPQEFVPSGAQQPNTHPYVIYNPNTDFFLYTFKEGNSLFMEKKGADELKTTPPLEVSYNYDGTNTPTNESRIDYNPMNDMMVAVWTSNSTVYFDAQALGMAVTPVSSDDVAVKLYPNPATTGIHLACTATQPATAAFTLTDVTGRVVMQQDVKLAAGANDIALALPALPTGQYIAALRGDRVNFAAQLSIR